MDPVEDPSWNNYPATLLKFSSSLVVDLRTELAETTRNALSKLAIPSPFAIISAADPTGHNDDDAVNEAAASVLQREIDNRQFSCVSVTGMSADGTHHEHAFAIHLSAVEARRLALDADQSAYFWYDGSCFWLVGARVQTPPLRLPASITRN